MRIAWALALFMGPGYALVSFLAPQSRPKGASVLALHFGLSLSCWALLLTWIPSPLCLGPVSATAIALGCWASGLAKAGIERFDARTRSDNRANLAPDAWHFFAFIAALSLSIISGLWALNDVVAGLGSDSYHHTLITQLIVETGRVPENYHPYAPLESFSYHFGFHAAASVFVWLSGLGPLLLVPLTTQLMITAASLSTAFLTESFTRSRFAAGSTLVMTGLLCVFPSFYINWGRATQAAGLVLLPLLLGILWMVLQSKARPSMIIMAGVLAAATAVTHSRVLLMAVLGTGAIALMSFWVKQWRPKAVSDTVVRVGASGLTGMLLASPWLLRLFEAGERILRPTGQASAVSFFSLNRLGDHVFHYLSNPVILGITFLMSLAGFWLCRKPLVIMVLWSIGLWILSQPGIGGYYVDPVSVFISLFVPAGVIIGCGLEGLRSKVAIRYPPVRMLVILALAGLAIWGAYLRTHIVESEAVYVGREDLEAMSWIRSNVGPSARFMVNTYHWDYSNEMIIGPDAGYWIPLLCNRSTVTLPMVYLQERVADPNMVRQLIALDRLSGNLTTPDAIKLLQLSGVTHVYLGKRGGVIPASSLLQSPAFRLLYRKGPIHVFAFAPADLQVPVGQKAGS